MKNINYIWTKNFNSHAHVERDCGKEHTTSDTPNFNSHAHVERDFCNSCGIAENVISTHTLTWSVTYCFFSQKLSIKFQLTRSRGA